MKPSDLKDEGKDPVWELLQRSPRRGAGPMFVADVLREVRKLGDDGQAEASSWFSALFAPFSRPAIAFASAAAVLVAGFGLAQLWNDGGDAVVEVSPPDAPGVVEASDLPPVPTPVPAAPVEALASAPADADSHEQWSAAEQRLEEIDYLGELVAITDPGALSDQMMADLLY